MGGEREGGEEWDGMGKGRKKWERTEGERQGWDTPGSCLHSSPRYETWIKHCSLYVDLQFLPDASSVSCVLTYVECALGKILQTLAPSQYLINHPGQLRLAIPPWVGKMSSGDGTATAGEENGEFCVTVGPVTRTADILT